MTAAPAPSPQQIRDRLLQAIDPQSNVSTARRARGYPTGGAGTPSSGRSPAPPPPAEGTPGAARPPPPPLLPPGPRRDALLPGHRKPPLRAVAGSCRLRARPRSGSRRRLSARSLRGARGSFSSGRAPPPLPTPRRLPAPSGSARPCGARPGGLPTPGRGSGAACRGLWAGLRSLAGRPPVPRPLRRLPPQTPGPGLSPRSGGARRASKVDPGHWSGSGSGQPRSSLLSFPAER